MLEKWKSLVQCYNIEDTIFALLVHTCNRSSSDCLCIRLPWMYAGVSAEAHSHVFQFRWKLKFLMSHNNSSLIKY